MFLIPAPKALSGEDAAEKKRHERLGGNAGSWRWLGCATKEGSQESSHSSTKLVLAIADRLGLSRDLANRLEAIVSVVSCEV